MAGAAAKKSSSRQRQALLQYAAAALVANAIFFAVRFGLGSGVTFREWLLLAVAEVTLLASGWSLVWTASEWGALAASSLDFFAIACATLVLSSIWSKGWWVLIGVPAYLIYQWGGFLRNLLGWGPKAPVDTGAPSPANTAASPGKAPGSRGKPARR